MIKSFSEIGFDVSGFIEPLEKMRSQFTFSRIEKHPFDDKYFKKALHPLAYILRWGYPHMDFMPDSLRGLRILDLGCGSEIGNLHDGYIKETEVLGDMRRIFEPWFCRLASLCGAQVTGIDLGFSSVENEPFTTINSDLTRKNVLEQFPDHSFDLILSRHFVEPEDYYGSSPSLKNLDKDQLVDIKNHLIGSAWLKLDQSGLLLWQYNLYQKTNDAGENLFLGKIPLMKSHDWLKDDSKINSKFVS